MSIKSGNTVKAVTQAIKSYVFSLSLVSDSLISNQNSRWKVNLYGKHMLKGIIVKNKSKKFQKIYPDSSDLTWFDLSEKHVVIL